jgi:hypothetical protein
MWIQSTSLQEKEDLSLSMKEYMNRASSNNRKDGSSQSILIRYGAMAQNIPSEEKK